MLRTERPDYRRSDEGDLLEGLRSRDALALAEAYHRTCAAAHACARRLLGGARPAEALMQAVYDELWESPPETTRLEGWVRARCFRIGAAHLRERGEPPASPSLTALLPGLPKPEHASLDAAEQALAALTEAERLALLLAHDQGVPATAQDAPDAVTALDRALVALAGPGEGVEEATAQSCADLAELADWTLGLLEEHAAARIAAEVAERPPCAARSRALRRGRRRIEGLPPAPDMGQRILASVLTASQGHPGAVGAARERDTAGTHRGDPGGPGGAPVPGPIGSPLGPAAAPRARAPLPSALDEGVENPWGPLPAGPSLPAAEPADAALAGEERADVGAPAPDSPHDVMGVRPPAADEPDEPPVEPWRDEETDTFGEDVALSEHPGEDAAGGRGVADLTDEPPPDEEEATPAGDARAGRMARRLLSVLAVIVVLVGGAALGIWIGLLFVGGQ